MQSPRGSADTVMGVPAIEHRSRQLFARGEVIGEVERIVTASDTNLAYLILLYTDAPGAAPRQRAKPYFACVFVHRAAALDGEPRIVLVPGRASTAFQHRFTGEDFLVIQAIPRRPPPPGGRG